MLDNVCRHCGVRLVREQTRAAETQSPTDCVRGARGAFPGQSYCHASAWLTHRAEQAVQRAGELFGLSFCTSRLVLVLGLVLGLVLVLAAFP